MCPQFLDLLPLPVAQTDGDELVLRLIDDPIFDDDHLLIIVM